MLLIEWPDGGKTFYNHYLLGAAPFNFQMYSSCLEKLDKLLYVARQEW